MIAAVVSEFEVVSALFLRSLRLCGELKCKAIYGRAEKRRVRRA